MGLFVHSENTFLDLCVVFVTKSRIIYIYINKIFIIRSSLYKYFKKYVTYIISKVLTDRIVVIISTYLYVCHFLIYVVLVCNICNKKPYTKKIFVRDWLPKTYVCIFNVILVDSVLLFQIKKALSKKY